MRVLLGIMASRQRDWQVRKHKEGLCTTCAQPVNMYKYHCDECQRKRRISIRKANGHRAWEPGMPGRPPKWAERVKEGA